VDSSLRVFLVSGPLCLNSLVNHSQKGSIVVPQPTCCSTSTRKHTLPSNDNTPPCRRALPLPPLRHRCPPFTLPPSTQSSPPPSAPSTSRTKQCPACLKSFAPTGFGTHLNSKTCGEALTSEHLDSINYVRCPVSECQRICHASRIKVHVYSHADDIPAPSPQSASTVVTSCRSS
jgi:hypothetical protein